MTQFVDRVELHLRGGDGGHGCASIHREKFKPLGGPDGGNGGRGGDVVLEVDPQVTTLLTYRYGPHRRAPNGGPGRGGHRHGADGVDEVLPVPDGTVVRTSDGEVLVDLLGAGTRVTVAPGGRGGLGNAALASPRRKAPGFALRGEPGTQVDVVLELRTVADVALVGFPSAGKSSLVAALSAARPAIADYPFTTLTPQLGVVEAGQTRFTVADVPGLVEGASEGRGLGLEFLRHVERCSVLVHVLDTATLDSDRDPLGDLDVVLDELARYEVGDERGPLVGRPAIVALNKVDTTDGREMAELVAPELRARGWQVYEVSAASHQGLRELSFAMARLVEADRAARPVARGPARVVLRPPAAGEPGFDVRVERHAGRPVYRVLGSRPERWVRQTDFGNDEAVGYLADRLARAGVEEALFRAGAQAGAEVAIGPGDDAVLFDWEPTITAGAELVGGPRGTDPRLPGSSRASREERRQEADRRRAARAATQEELAAERAGEQSAGDAAGAGRRVEPVADLAGSPGERAAGPGVDRAAGPGVERAAGSGVGRVEGPAARGEAGEPP